VRCLKDEEALELVSKVFEQPDSLDSGSDYHPYHLEFALEGVEYSITVKDSDSFDGDETVLGVEPEEDRYIVEYRVEEKLDENTCRWYSERLGADDYRKGLEEALEELESLEEKDYRESRLLS